MEVSTWGGATMAYSIDMGALPPVLGVKGGKFDTICEFNTTNPFRNSS